ncbi:chemotaxis protein CheW [Ammoniphilus oxalaticus]|uniref:Chemotaxis protein CheW n=2 Tax=Ammoniphilus oxalaticus TaxID=66863 RepID=A0A419SLA5_9BACL|nr:chemotaxis protein CheW [Ammoniphilus oxalaticus]
MKVIVFQLFENQFGVDVSQVRSIERVVEITKVPRVPSFVKGVIHLRGAVIPVIDLKERLMLDEQPLTDDSRIILLIVNGYEVGAIVDAASDVVDIPLEAIEPPPQMMAAGVDMKFLRGIAKLSDQLLVLLDLDRVLNTEEIEQIFEGEGLGT